MKSENGENANVLVTGEELLRKAKVLQLGNTLPKVVLITI